MRWEYFIVAIIGYLMGGINFAFIFAKINKKDIRTMGSGNPGTMNVMRNLGAKWGILTFIGDAAKGALPALIGYFWLLNTGDGVRALYLGGICSILGHMFPLFNGFKGGKGVATSIGVFLVADPKWSGITFAILLVVLIIFKYSSLSSLTFVTVMTVIQGHQHMGDLMISVLLFLICLLVWWGHRKNIVQLIVGTERKSNLLKVLKKIKKPKDNSDKTVAKNKDL